MAAGERADRRLAERRGRRAETLAAWYLRLKGYRILARRYRTPVGEIDLIVRRGRLVAFVEVKRRPTEAEAAEAVTRPAAGASPAPPRPGLPPIRRRQASTSASTSSSAPPAVCRATSERRSTPRASRDTSRRPDPEKVKHGV